jgi:hypothetical protein
MPSRVYGACVRSIPRKRSPIAVALLAVLICAAGIFMSIHYRDQGIAVDTQRARDDFAMIAANLGRGLRSALSDASASFVGVHAVMRVVPSITFWDFAEIASAFRTSVRHLSLEYVPYVRNETERLYWEQTISKALNSTLVFQQVAYHKIFRTFINFFLTCCCRTSNQPLRPKHLHSTKTRRAASHSAVFYIAVSWHGTFVHAGKW